MGPAIGKALLLFPEARSPSHLVEELPYYMYHVRIVIDLVAEMIWRPLCHLRFYPEANPHVIRRPSPGPLATVWVPHALRYIRLRERGRPGTEASIQQHSAA